MKIDAIRLREVNMPLAHPFETSFGRTTGRRILLIEVVSDGVSAWGECVAGEHPYFSDEMIDTAWFITETELAPRLTGRTLASGRDVPALLAPVRGHRMAKAALENAVWELDATRQGIALATLLGGTRERIACGVSIGIQSSPTQLMDTIARELAAGYQRIKLKCKPGWDAEIFEQVRMRWPEILLSCDANSAYTMDDADHIAAWDRFKLLMIEQPMWYDDFYFHAELQKRIETPLCLDECIRNRRDAEAALEHGSGRVINIKVGRVGGFTEALAIHEVAVARGIPVWCGGMLESGIGRAQNVALSSLPGFTLPGDVSASKRYWERDVIVPAVEVSAEGEIVVPYDRPGRGWEIDAEWLDRVTVRHQVVRAQ